MDKSRNKCEHAAIIYFLVKEAIYQKSVMNACIDQREYYNLKQKNYNSNVFYRAEKKYFVYLDKLQKIILETGHVVNNLNLDELSRTPNLCNILDEVTSELDLFLTPSNAR